LFDSPLFFSKPPSFCVAITAIVNARRTKMQNQARLSEKAPTRKTYVTNADIHRTKIIVIKSRYKSVASFGDFAEAKITVFIRNCLGNKAMFLFRE
jgi:hypothetical protein